MMRQTRHCPPPTLEEIRSATQSANSREFIIEKELPSHLQVGWCIPKREDVRLYCTHCKSWVRHKVKQPVSHRCDVWDGGTSNRVSNQEGLAPQERPPNQIRINATLAPNPDNDLGTALTVLKRIRVNGILDEHQHHSRDTNLTYEEVQVADRDVASKRRKLSMNPPQGDANDRFKVTLDFRTGTESACLAMRVMQQLMNHQAGLKASPPRVGYAPSREASAATPPPAPRPPLSSPPAHLLKPPAEQYTINEGPRPPSTPPPAHMLKPATSVDNDDDGAETDEWKQVRASALKYTQKSMGNTFSDGRCLRTLVDELNAGQHDFDQDDFLSLECIYVGLEVASLDNRRLKCIKDHADAMKTDPLIWVQITGSFRDWHALKKVRRNCDTNNMGRSIHVRGGLPEKPSRGAPTRFR